MKTSSHYGWFLQNLGKDFIRTNMHTTVGSKELGIYELESCPIFIGIFFAQFNQIWNITNVIVLWFVLLLSPWTLITTLIMQSYIVFDMQWFLGGLWKQSFPSRKNLFDCSLSCYFLNTYFRYHPFCKSALIIVHHLGLILYSVDSIKRTVLLNVLSLLSVLFSTVISKNLY